MTQRRTPARLGLGTMLVVLGLALFGCDEAEGDIDIDADAQLDTDPLEHLQATSLSYFMTVDWEDAVWSEDAWVITTDLGYTLGIHAWQQSMTNVELVACDEDFRHSGHVHDLSQIELQRLDDLVSASTDPQALGVAPGSGGSYCGLYEIMGTVAPRDARGEIVSALRGWYQLPGTDERHTFEALHAVPVAVLPALGSGRWDPALVSGQARVELRYRPARAFDGLVIEDLSALDLGFAAAQNLGRGVALAWALGEP